MKKTSLMIMTLLTLISFGCGSGSSGPLNTETNATGSSEEYGAVKFRVLLESTESEGLAKRLSKIPANTTGIMVRAWDDAGHDVLTEFPISQGTTTFDAEIPLPVGTNYRLDAIAYNEPPYRYKSILTAAQSDPFEIKANTTTALSLTLNPYIVDFSGTTTEATGGEPLTIQVKITGPDFFSNQYSVSNSSLNAGFEAWINDGYAPYPRPIQNVYVPNRNRAINNDGTVTYTLSLTLDAPIVTESQILYYQLELWASDPFRPGGTDIPPFLFLPSLTAGETLGTITVNPPTGGVIVTMQ